MIRCPALTATYSSTTYTISLHDALPIYAITLTNTGSATWNASGANPVWLAVVFGTSSDAVRRSSATTPSHELPGDAASGSWVTLTVAVTAPATPGSYVLRHRLINDGLAW